MSSGARETAWLMGANTRVGTPMHSPQYQGTKPGYTTTRAKYIYISGFRVQYPGKVTNALSNKGIWGYSTDTKCTKLYWTWTLPNCLELQCTLYFTAICSMHHSAMQCSPSETAEPCSSMSCWDILHYPAQYPPMLGWWLMQGWGDISDQFSTQDSTFSHPSTFGSGFWCLSLDLFVATQFGKSRVVGKFQISGYFEPILCRIASLASIGSDHAFF